MVEIVRKFSMRVCSLKKKKSLLALLVRIDWIKRNFVLIWKKYGERLMRRFTEKLKSPVFYAILETRDGISFQER